jgi:hypothetical protein
VWVQGTRHRKLVWMYGSAAWEYNRCFCRITVAVPTNRVVPQYTESKRSHAIACLILRCRVSDFVFRDEKSRAGAAAMWS